MPPFRCPTCGVGQMTLETIPDHHTKLGGRPVYVKNARIAKCNHCGEISVGALELERWEWLQKEQEDLSLQPYQHDCDRCIWVSWVKCLQAENGWGNMYFCPRIKSADGSILIRYGNEPREYLSYGVGDCKITSLGLSSFKDAVNPLQTLRHILDLAEENMKGIDGYEQIAEWARLHVYSTEETLGGKCICPCHCGGWDGAAVCKQPCDECDCPD